MQDVRGARTRQRRSRSPCSATRLTRLPRFSIVRRNSVVLPSLSATTARCVPAGENDSAQTSLPPSGAAPDPCDGDDPALRRSAGRRPDDGEVPAVGRPAGPASGRERASSALGRRRLDLRPRHLDGEQILVRRPGDGEPGTGRRHRAVRRVDDAHRGRAHVVRELRRRRVGLRDVREPVALGRPRQARQQTARLALVHGGAGAVRRRDAGSPCDRTSGSRACHRPATTRAPAPGSRTRSSRRSSDRPRSSRPRGARRRGTAADGTARSSRRVPARRPRATTAARRTSVIADGSRP